MNLPCNTLGSYLFSMPVHSKFMNYKTMRKILLGLGYFTYAISISKTQIKDTYNEIYIMADTVNKNKSNKENTNTTNLYITHAITTLWTLPMIPAILLYNPPYQAKKTIEKYLPSSNNNDRV